MKKIINFLCFIPYLCLAQSSLVGKVHIGYSNPTSMYQSYVFTVSEVEGRFSQNFFLGYEKKRGIHQLRLQSGLSLLGFQTRQFQGLTPNPLFPYIPDGSPTLLKKTYKLWYLDNSLGYGINIKSKMNITASLHHLLNIKSHVTDNYLFTDITIPSNVIDKGVIEIDLRERGLSFYNHFAGSLEFSYALSENMRIGSSYLLGLNEFNPFLLTSRHKTRLNQNFSIFLSHKLWSF